MTQLFSMTRVDPRGGKSAPVKIMAKRPCATAKAVRIIERRHFGFRSERLSARAVEDAINTGTNFMVPKKGLVQAHF